MTLEYVPVGSDCSWTRFKNKTHIEMCWGMPLSESERHSNAHRDDGDDEGAYPTALEVKSTYSGCTTDVPGASEFPLFCDCSLRVYRAGLFNRYGTGESADRQSADTEKLLARQTCAGEKERERESAKEQRETATRREKGDDTPCKSLSIRENLER